MSSELDILYWLKRVIDDRINEIETNNNASISYEDLRPRVTANGNQKIFRFSIGSDGSFSYKPDSDWEYAAGDAIRFESESGPFRITAVADPANPIPVPGPLSRPIESQGRDRGVWYAELPPYQSTLSSNLRRAIYNEQGYISRYRYVIEGKRNGKTYRDDTRNGVYSC